MLGAAEVRLMHEFGRAAMRGSPYMEEEIEGAGGFAARLGAVRVRHALLGLRDEHLCQAALWHYSVFVIQ